MVRIVRGVESSFRLESSFPLIVATLALNSCAVGPNYHRPDVATPVQYKEPVNAAAPDAAPPHDWWSLFNDATLNDLERQVEVSNQNLAAAEAAFRQARALITEQRAVLFPNITVDASASRSHGATRTTTDMGTGTTTIRSPQIYQADIGASWELDVWGRLRRALQNARALAEASAADLAAAKLSAKSQLALTYLQLREADAEQSLVAQTVSAYARSLQIAQNRYNAGVTSKSDLLQAQTQLYTAQDQQEALGLQRRQLENAIAALIGKPASDFTLASVDPWNLLVPEIPTGVPSTLLQRRPDIAAAERRAAAASAAIGVQVAEYFPSVTLSGTVGFLSTSLGKLFSHSNESHSADLSLSQTLFDAGARHARVVSARAAYDESVAQYRQTVLAAFADVENQLAAASVLAREHDLRRQASSAADEAERIALNQYKAGAISFTDVVVVQAAALNARRSLATAALARQTTAVSLATALGGGWTPDQ